MLTWLFTFIILVIIIFAMAIGVILARKPIAGSCGGLNKLGLKEDCPICGKPAKEKEESYEEENSEQNSEQKMPFYDAMR